MACKGGSKKGGKGSKASPAMKKKANFARNAAKWKH